MTYSSEVLADAPGLYFRLGDAAGNATMADSSGNSRNGAYNPYVGAATGLLLGDTDGAAYFEGNASYASASATALPLATAFSVEFWIQASSSRVTTVIAREGSTGQIFEIGQNYTNKLYFYNLAVGKLYYTTATLIDGGKHHVVFAVNGTTLTTYVDGVLDATATMTGAVGTTGGNTFYLGSDYGQNAFFQGTLDEVAYYPSVLTADRVAAHYAAGTPAPPPPTAFPLAVTSGGSGTSVVTTETFPTPELQLTLPDDVINRGPSSVTVVLTEGVPLTDVAFDIDGTVVMTAPTNTQGEIVALSVPLDADLATEGEHTITATQAGSLSNAATFTVLHPPWTGLRSVIPDADPVAIPGTETHNTRHWVLQDLTPEGLGSWIMPSNPSTWQPPHVRRSLEAVHTTAQTGIFHVTESGDDPIDFTFSGYCPTKDMHDQLLKWGDLNRRFYLIDHRNRAWKVAITNVDMVARTRQVGFDGKATDWGHDYTVTALCYDQEWAVPKS